MSTIIRPNPSHAGTSRHVIRTLVPVARSGPSVDSTQRRHTLMYIGTCGVTGLAPSAQSLNAPNFSGLVRVSDYHDVCDPKG